MQLEQSIIKLTTTIKQEYPELSEFIIEMPDNNAESEEVTIKSLEEYYNSFRRSAKKICKTHNETEKKKFLKLLCRLTNLSSSEDIYQQLKEEKDLNPEDITKKESTKRKGRRLERKGL
jgi:hypothetical protein